MTSSYLKRYVSGAESEVWAELVSLGTEAFDKGVLGDALAVSAEMTRRASHNLAILAKRLRDIGYEFANPAGPVQEATDADRAKLTELEAQHGRLPIVLNAWHQRFASVDFSQSENQMNGEGKLAGLGRNAALYFLSIRESLEFRQKLLEQDDELGLTATDEEEQEEGFFLPLGGYASNCEPIGVFLPATGADAVIYNDGAGDVFFVQHMRTAFRWFGFPYWQRLAEPSRMRPRKGEPDFTEVLRLMNCDLLRV